MHKIALAAALATTLTACAVVSPFKEYAGPAEGRQDGWCEANFTGAALVQCLRYALHDEIYCDRPEEYAHKATYGQCRAIAWTLVSKYAKKDPFDMSIHLLPPYGQ